MFKYILNPQKARWKKTLLMPAIETNLFQKISYHMLFSKKKHFY
jgi:hypothetical protein